MSNDQLTTNTSNVPLIEQVRHLSGAAVTRLTTEEIAELCGEDAVTAGNLKPGQKYRVQFTPGKGYKIDNEGGNRRQRRANQSHRRKQKS